MFTDISKHQIKSFFTEKSHENQHCPKFIKSGTFKLSPPKTYGH